MADGPFPVTTREPVSEAAAALRGVLGRVLFVQVRGLERDVRLALRRYTVNAWLAPYARQATTFLFADAVVRTPLFGTAFYMSLRNASSVSPASHTMPPIVNALTGLCLGMVRMRTPYLRHRLGDFDFADHGAA